MTSGLKETLTGLSEHYSSEPVRGIYHYRLSEVEIEVLAKADLYRKVVRGDLGYSLRAQVKASQNLEKLMETDAYKEAWLKLTTPTD